MEQIYRLYVNNGAHENESIGNQIELNDLSDLRENFHLFVTFTDTDKFPTALGDFIMGAEYLAGFTFVNCPIPVLNQGLECLSRTKIQELSISFSALSIKEIKKIIDIAIKLRISSLSLSSCELGPEHIQVLYNNIGKLSLEELSLSSNKLMSFDFSKVFGSLKLRYLDLSFNSFDQSVIDSIPKAIDSNAANVSDLSVFILPSDINLDYSSLSASLDIQNVYCSPRHGIFVLFNDMSLYFDGDNIDEQESIHPLHDELLPSPISFIYDPGLVERNKNIANTEWKSSMVNIKVAKTVGEFWTIFNRLPTITKLPERSYIGIFRGDSCPDWDRPEFADGHRAIVVSNHTSAWKDSIHLLTNVVAEMASGNAPEALRGVVLENYTGNRPKFFAWFSQMEEAAKREYNTHLTSLTPRSSRLWQWRFTDFTEQRKVPRRGTFKRNNYHNNFQK